MAGATSLMRCYTVMDVQCRQFFYNTVSNVLLLFIVLNSLIIHYCLLVLYLHFETQSVVLQHSILIKLAQSNGTVVTQFSIRLPCNCTNGQGEDRPLVPLHQLLQNYCNHTR